LTLTDKTEWLTLMYLIGGYSPMILGLNKFGWSGQYIRLYGIPFQANINVLLFYFSTIGIETEIKTGNFNILQCNDSLVEKGPPFPFTTSKVTSCIFFREFSTHLEITALCLNMHHIFDKFKIHLFLRFFLQSFVQFRDTYYNSKSIRIFLDDYKEIRSNYKDKMLDIIAECGFKKIQTTENINIYSTENKINEKVDNENKTTQATEKEPIQEKQNDNNEENKEENSVNKNVDRGAEHKCGFCKIISNEKKLKKCGRCFKQYYCSVQCQRQDWPTHKCICNNIK